MRGSQPCPRISLHRSHLDSATYRAVLRLFAHCAQVQYRARPASPCVSPSPPARGGAVTSSGEGRCSDSDEEERVKTGGDGIGAAAELGILERSDDPVGLRHLAYGDGREEIPAPVEQADRNGGDSDCLTKVKSLASREIPLPGNSAEQREDGRNDTTSIDESNFRQYGSTRSEQEPSLSQPLATGSGQEKFSERNQIAYNEIEEGEISDDLAAPNSPCDLESSDEILPEESEQIASSNLSSEELRMMGDQIQREETASLTKIVEVREKKKKGPLTESRKEKKKLAKKRKRAETNKKLGVKRLKLEMPAKTRKVIPCNFFQKGRCQKGDLCKFSHDLIPDTKSTPCTFFARGTCLKGVDCPFDHELSKYPCHNFASEGWCSRGENCRFSHKVTTGEFPSASASASGRKQTPQKPLTLISSNLKSTAFKTLATTIPKGVCFLSFAKERLSSGGSLPIQRELTLSGKSTLIGSLDEDRCLGPLEKNPILAQNTAEIRSNEGGSLRDDASRILEEFLLSGLSS